MKTYKDEESTEYFIELSDIVRIDYRWVGETLTYGNWRAKVTFLHTGIIRTKSFDVFPRLLPMLITNDDNYIDARADEVRKSQYRTIEVLPVPIRKPELSKHDGYALCDNVSLLSLYKTPSEQILKQGQDILERRALIDKENNWQCQKFVAFPRILNYQNRLAIVWRPSGFKVYTLTKTSYQRLLTLYHHDLGNTDIKWTNRGALLITMKTIKPVSSRRKFGQTYK